LCLVIAANDSVWTNPSTLKPRCRCRPVRDGFIVAARLTMAGLLTTSVLLSLARCRLQVERAAVERIFPVPALKL